MEKWLLELHVHVLCQQQLKVEGQLKELPRKDIRSKLMMHQSNTKEQRNILLVN